MINLDNILNNNNKEHNEKWPFIPDHPYRILIIVGCGSGKTNTLLDLINEQEDIDIIYLYSKYLSDSKYEYLIRNRKNTGIKHLNDSKALIECSNTMNDIDENMDNYNPKRKGKILIVFDDMIVHYRTITIDEAESKQVELNTVLNLLKKYSQKHDKYATLKNNLVDNESKFYEGREKIIEGFKNEVFPFYYDEEYQGQIEFEKRSRRANNN